MIHFNKYRYNLFNVKYTQYFIYIYRKKKREERAYCILLYFFFYIISIVISANIHIFVIKKMKWFMQRLLLIVSNKIYM